MIVSIVKGKCRDISSVSQRVEGVGEGRIVKREVPSIDESRIRDRGGFGPCRG